MTTDPYTLLRTALALFDTPPARLDALQLRKAQQQAAREYELESRVLHSPEAAGVVVSASEVEQALQEIRGRYADETEFLADLGQNQLDEASLQQALVRECRVNATLALASKRAAKISEVEVGIYYHAHPEKFHRPERREVRQILMTINAEFPENQRAQVSAKMAEIAAKLAKKPHKFAELALRHSECPSALQGGLIGLVPRGALYPQLDAALFQMQAGQISAILETELGLHILHCSRIERGGKISLLEATPTIRNVLEQRAQRLCQRAWLASLPPSQPQDPPYGQAA